MKLAITGKGGVGKSTLSASLALLAAEQGSRVLAVDADPDANLASALGISQAEQQKVMPIAERKALIEERTGAKINQYGQVFKINPEVADVAEQFCYSHHGVELLVLGAVEVGGSGCACPESVFLKALVMDLVLHKDESLILDMEAGIEHLGRATARGVDMMLVVVEPGQRSVDCALRIKKMARDIGLTSVKAVANKIGSDADRDFIAAELGDLELVGCIPYSDKMRAADRNGCSALDGADNLTRASLENILQTIEKEK